MTKKEFENLQDGQLLSIKSLARTRLHIYRKEGAFSKVKRDGYTDKILFYNEVISLKDVRLATLEEYNEFVEREVKHFERVIEAHKQAFINNGNSTDRVLQVQVETYKEVGKTNVR